MKQIKNGLKSFSGWSIVSALFFGLDFALFYYYYFTHQSFYSKRTVAIVLFLFAIFAFLLYRGRKYTAFGKINHFSKWQRIFLIGTTILLSWFAVKNILEVPIDHYLLPKVRVEIQTFPQKEGERGYQTRILWMNSGLGDISFDSLEKEGQWDREGGGITTSDSGPASLLYNSRVGDRLVILFQQTKKPRQVRVRAGAIDQTINWDPAAQDIPIILNFPIPWYSQAVVWLVSVAFAGFWILLVMVWGLTWKAGRKVPVHRYEWAFYLLPMLLVWGIYLLTYWPGAVNADFPTIWKQVVYGVFNDWHPAFYSLTVWLVTRINFSYETVAIFQILVFSGVLTYGLIILRTIGVSPWLTSAMAVAFLVLPIFGYISILLAKDLLYSASLTLVFIMLIRATFSNGEWFSHKLNWLWFGLACFGLSIYRHNGLPVALLILASLFLIFRQHRWKILYAGIACVAVWLFVCFPVYSMLKVQYPPDQIATIPLHHIAAHIASKTPLTPEETEFIKQINPVSLPYSPCTHDWVYYNKYTNHAFIGKHLTQIWMTSLALFVRDPWVDLVHWRRISSAVWEIRSYCPVELGTYITDPDISIAYPNYSGAAVSKLPALFPLLHKYLLFGSQNVFQRTWQPALYLYLAVFSVVIAGFRARNKILLVLLIPMFWQGIVISVINIDASFRYHIAFYMIGVLAIGMLGAPWQDPSPAEDGDLTTDSGNRLNG